MPAHAFWKGYLKLSLVTCPVAMSPATTASEKLRFHTINRKTGNRIESRYVDAETGKPVAREDEVKGYERGENDYVIVEDDELEAVALESTRTIEIDTFVPKTSIGWIWYDAPHYLVPDDRVGEEAFAVIREAMAASGTVGIARLVLYRRERAVLLEPRDRGIVLWTLRFGDEVRDRIETSVDSNGTAVDPKALALVRRLIDDRIKPWNTGMLTDPVQDRLRDIIATKKKGKRPAKAKKPEVGAPSNVINIMDALRQSLASEKSKGKKS